MESPQKNSDTEDTDASTQQGAEFDLLDVSPAPAAISKPTGESNDNPLNDFVNLELGGEEPAPVETGDLLDLMGDSEPQEEEPNLLGLGEDLLNLDAPAPNLGGAPDLLGGGLMDLSAPQTTPQNLNRVETGGDLNLIDLSAGNSAPIESNDTNLLGEDLLGGMSVTTPSTHSMPTQPQPTPDLLGGTDLLGGDLLGGTTEPVSSPSNILSIIGHEDDYIKLVLNCQKTNLNSTRIDVSFVNKTSLTITDVKMLVAVTKHLKMNLHPASGTIMEPNSTGGMTQVTQFKANYLLGC